MEIFKCEICGELKQSKSGLITHLQKHKISYIDYKSKFNIKEPTAMCKTCGKDIPLKRQYCSRTCSAADKDLQKSKGVKKIPNDKAKKLVCNICGCEIFDINNYSGSATTHLKSVHNITNKDYLAFYTVKDVEHRELFKCPLCEWTTADLENKSGWFTTHIKQKHNLEIDNFLIQYPEYSYLWKHHFNKKHRENFLFESIDNYVECKICGEKFKFITNSHLKLHGITQLEYKDKYGAICSITTSKILAQNYLNTLATYSDGRFISIAEQEIKNYIVSLGIQVTQSERKLISPYELDIYIPDYNIAIEYNGLYYHSELNGKDEKYHINKTNMCKQKSVQLIHIFEDEWLNKKDIVKNRLRHILNKNDNTIYARKCNVQLIDKRNKSIFLNEIHLQGNDKSIIDIGMFFEGELVSVMTFCKPRISLGSRGKTDHVYELSRFAAKHNIIGGFSKILKFFINNYKPNKIITYSDNRWGTGNVYEINGFTKISDGAPNYWYMNNYDIRYHRYNFTKNRIVEKFKGDPTLSEWDNMIQLGYDRIWDCGSSKYELIIK